MTDIVNDTTAAINPPVEKTFAEKWAEKEAAKERERQAFEDGAMHIFTGGRYVERILENWRNIHFTDQGKMRLANLAGFINALSMSGVENLVAYSKRLAVGIKEQLDYLNTYGGEDESESYYDDKPYMVKAPRFRIVLSDDGYLHSFGVTWYRRVNGIDPDGQKVNHDLAVSRHAPGTVNDDEKGTRAIWLNVHYTHYMDGGLNFHGSNDPFAPVQLTSNGSLWSVNT